MNPIKIDELKRQALKAGRGELCLVDAEDLLELLDEVKNAAKVSEKERENIYDEAWEACKEECERAIRYV